MSGRPNAELAYKVLDHIDANPELWDQSKWFGQSECGTTGCFAGWACLLSGDQPILDQFGLVTSYVLTDGNRVLVRERADELLGVYSADVSVVEDGDVVDLFDACNHRDRLGDFVLSAFGPRPDGAS